MGKQERKNQRISRTKREAAIAATEKKSDQIQYDLQEAKRKKREGQQFNITSEFNTPISPAILFIGTVESLLLHHIQRKPLDKNTAYPNNYYFFENNNLATADLLSEKLLALLKSPNLILKLVIPFFKNLLRSHSLDIPNGEIVGYVNNSVDEGLLNILVWIDNQAVSTNYQYYLEHIFKQISQDHGKKLDKDLELLLTDAEKIIIRRITFKYPEEIIGFEYHYADDQFEIITKNGKKSLHEIEVYLKKIAPEFKDLK